MRGFQLGTYVLEDKLGEGGMAEVWRARNPLLNTYAAVKFLVPRLAGNPDIERRFLGEGKRQAALQHPNIVSAFDFHYVDNRSFLVMRYVDGENLEQRLFRLQAPVPLSEATAISRDVLSALDYAHSQGVVHRDIKPSNLLIERNGRANVLDFGIALVLGQERLTRVDVAIGTAHYMSPEQIVGSRTIDGRTDIYSFGCVLYEILTHVAPYDGNEEDGLTDYVVKEKHLREEPVPPSQLNPAIPAQVERVILRCLAKKPDDRYRTCADVMADLSAPSPTPSFTTRTPTVFEGVSTWRCRSGSGAHANHRSTGCLGAAGSAGCCRRGESDARQPRTALGRPWFGCGCFARRRRLLRFSRHFGQRQQEDSRYDEKNRSRKDSAAGQSARQAHATSGEDKHCRPAARRADLAGNEPSDQAGHRAASADRAATQAASRRRQQAPRRW